MESLQAWGAAYDVAIYGDYAYIAGEPPFGLQVADISEPPSLVYTGCFDASYPPYGITVAGGYVCLAGSRSSLQLQMHRCEP